MYVYGRMKIPVVFWNGPNHTLPMRCDGNGEYKYAALSQKVQVLPHRAAEFNFPIGAQMIAQYVNYPQRLIAKYDKCIFSNVHQSPKTWEQMFAAS